MKAAILVEQNQPLIIDDIDLPSQLAPGQVLVKIHASGICGSQLGEIAGIKGQDKYLPHLMGHEGCGTILEIGPGVKYLKENDLVVLHWRKGKGIESDVPSYKWNNQKVNAGWVTTFNTHAVVSENRCTAIPHDTDKEIAALFGCAITTGFGVIENNVDLKLGQSVVVFGAGGIGLNIIQAAYLRSAYPIIAIDIYENRLSLAKDIGATHTINSKINDTKDMISDILNGQSLDVFIDNTGVPKIIELGYNIIDNHGKVVLVGVPKKGQNINIFSLPLHFGKTIHGSFGGESKPEEDIIRYLNLIKKKNIKLDKLITDRFSLSEINDAIQLMKSGQSSGRIIINL